MYYNDQFEMIAKALDSTKKSLETQVNFDDPAIQQVDKAKEAMIESLAHATSIDHQLIIETMFNH
ncbi:hypothetical protein JOC75_000022 [Metabacillus crassostreae]|uniref:hypothetical protein n=1 Tax=Metabacillus crassostreae TaxID=929098 RepID=UPI00195A0E4E|nr:hypothetical protein [Metabacillus crassostreae]MBM7602052.1 hypothetical protein [Metabacillus crassostreae]